LINGGWWECLLWLTGRKPITHYSAIKEENHFLLYGGSRQRNKQTPHQATHALPISPSFQQTSCFHEEQINELRQINAFLQ